MDKELQISATTTTTTAPQAHLYDRRWLAAGAMMAAVLMDMIDVTVVNVALPTVHRDLHAGSTQLEWIVSAYMLAFAATLITAGSLGDLLGRKRLFLMGIAAFGLASLCAGLAGSPAELIVARVVQGAAAAVMTPQLLATFRAMFLGRERGTAFGLYGVVLGFASAIGMLLGGVLTSADLFGWSWRAIFFVNLPVAVVSFIASAKLMPETRERSAKRPDLLGAGLLIAALVAIVYPLLEGRRLGWPVWGWVVLVGGLAALSALALIEVRGRGRAVAPLLRPALLRTPAFALGLCVEFVFSAGLGGLFFIFSIWVQTGQHYSPLRAGLTWVGFAVGSLIPAPLAVPLALRYGRLVLVVGALMLTVGVVGVDIGAHHVGSGTNQWPLIPGLAVAGAGLSLLVIPLVNVVLAAVPASAAGGASGLFTTAQQVGGAIGIAAVGTIFFGYIDGHSYVAAFTRSLPLVAALFLACAGMSLALPRSATPDPDGL